MTQTELAAAVEAEIEDELDQIPPASSPVRGLVGGLGKVMFQISGTFADPAWLMYKRLKGLTWDRVGSFHGIPSVQVRGGREYVYRPDKADPFRFVRHTGEEIVVGAMATDGGSVPRACWAVPGLDPWTYMPAFLIHDWEFVTHHCNAGWSKSFEDVNQTLAEAVYTMMRVGVGPVKVAEDWRVAAVIYLAVMTRVGRRVWDAPWTQEQCQLVLNV